MKEEVCDIIMDYRKLIKEEIAKLHTAKGVKVNPKLDSDLGEQIVADICRKVVKNCSIPAVVHRFIPQPIEIEKLMKEKLEHRMINDDIGWTGEWRMSAKDVLDVIIDLQNGV